ncbi:double-strand break repair protein AddB [Sandarakinorhabdus sp.]|uniref:double-strand break repair protein AddB n=1 Tax=Sandarakinorhabdus sp. TaxID=1916663 RepID=UPI003F7196C2
MAMLAGVTDLLSRPPPRMLPLFNIPLQVAFADALAAGLLARTAANPVHLARSLVLLPNRRAVTAVTEAFVRQLGDLPSGGGGLLLPRLVPVGDLDDAGFDRLAAGDAPILPAVAPLLRRFELARLAAKLPGDARAAVERLRLGDALGEVLDALLAEEIDPEALRGAADGQDLADHWQKTLAFLELVIAVWPQAREGHGGIEGATRLTALIDALIARWAMAPPAGLVVAAGIANPTPAVQRLLGAVLRLPQGLVVLPGLDGDCSEAGQARWDGIRLADPVAGQRGERESSGHPQWAMKALLAGLGLSRDDMQIWAQTGGQLDGPDARAEALVAALAPAVAAHAQPVPEPGAFADLALAECATAAEEAQVVALALREAVEQPGIRAALITPDPDLARRVAAHCQRWGIAIDSSAGTPLSLMPPGALALDLVAAMAEAFAPTRLLAMLKHGLVRRGDGGFAAAVLLADLALRGVRPPPGLDAAGEAILRFIDEQRHDHAAMAAWWDDVAAALAPLEALREAGAADLSGVMAALRHAITALTGDDGWSGPDGRQLAALVAAVEADGALFGSFKPDEAPALLSALMTGSNVRVPGQGHPRLSILGPVEAQLTRADVVILAGLNEGTWPGQPAPDPWLAPAIRARLGLPGTARAQGLAAQDFLRAASAPKVLITRARRDAGGPRLPSRLWLRLLAHAQRDSGRDGQTLRRRDDLVALARALDGAAQPHPQQAPRPNPPLKLRPRKLSITEIDTLIADPFAFHAKHILRLRPLDPLDQDPTAAMRGTLVHDVLERWIDDNSFSLARLDQIIAAELESEARHFPLLAAAWVPRMRVALHWAGEEILKREKLGTSFVAEASGRLDLPGGIVLSGKVDRIDRSEADELIVVDYKTGKPPAKGRVRDLQANQLALGLAMAVAGVLAKNGRPVATGLPLTIEYWQLQGARKAAGTIHAPLEGRDPIPAAEHVAAAVAHAGELAAHYLLAEHPFEPKLRPEWAWGDYDHLARVPEWINRPRAKA